MLSLRELSALPRHRFGGTCVGSAERIKNAAKLMLELPANKMVVVSAMGTPGGGIPKASMRYRTYAHTARLAGNADSAWRGRGGRSSGARRSCSCCRMRRCACSASDNRAPGTQAEPLALGHSRLRTGGSLTLLLTPLPLRLPR